MERGMGSEPCGGDVTGRRECPGSARELFLLRHAKEALEQQEGAGRSG